MGCQPGDCMWPLISFLELCSPLSHTRGELKRMQGFGHMSVKSLEGMSELKGKIERLSIISNNRHSFGHMSVKSLTTFSILPLPFLTQGAN